MPRLTRFQQISKFRQRLKKMGYITRSVPFDIVVDENHNMVKNWKAVTEWIKKYPPARRPGY